MAKSEKAAMSGRAVDLSNFDQRVVRDPRICGGEPIFKGTRVKLRTVLASLASGDTAEAILSDFPSLAPEDIRVAIAFALPAIPRIQ
jgi:uncharacterized protein (DUF433 family)